MNNMYFMKRQLSSHRFLLPPQSNEVKSMAQLLQKTFSMYPELSPVKGVVHIGAHKCEEAGLYESFGLVPEQVLWIDGNDDLCKEFPNIVNAVISDKDDADVEFIITDNDAMSSSILELKDHKIEHPDCLEEKRVSKKTVTLDTLLKRLHLPSDAFDFLVMDIQGAELLALKGATELLQHIQCIFTEVSDKELYAGCVLVQDLDAHLGRLNFVRIASDINKHGWGDAIYVRRLPSVIDRIRQNVVSVEINSGLGNRLFQLAFLYGLSREHGVKPMLMRNMIKPCNEHFTDPKRYEPFYRMFEMSHMNSPSINVIREPHNQSCVYRKYGKEPFCLNDKTSHLYIGYFQSEKYFAKHKTEIVQIFKQVLENTSSHMLTKYPDLSSNDKLMFVHVRGRDHIASDNPQHHMTQINSYYETCLERLAKDMKFMVCTDDVKYLMSLKFVNKLGNYTIVLENELDTLYVMSKCKAGGICTNSSYSWWGSYLNNDTHKQVFMPFPFLNGSAGFSDIYYEGVQQIQFKEHESRIHSMFDDIMNVRFIGEEVIVTVVQKKDYPLLDVMFGQTRATIQKFDKPVHQDIYSTFYAITAKNPEWRNANELSFVMSINGLRKEFHVKKTPVKKQGLVAMTMFKDDIEMISSYIHYYRKMGVEHFYLYYNDVHSVSSLPRFPDVTFIQWNYPYYNRDNENTHYAQVGALTDFLYWSKHFAKYVLFNDLDEYIFWKGPPDVTLKQFVLQNRFDVYGFQNNFIYLKNKGTEVVPDEHMYRMIENDEFVRTHLVYEFGKRSKCIVNPNAISCIGVHKTILPKDVTKCVLGFDTAGIYHVCNIKSRVHVSITKEFLNRIS